MMCAFVVEVPVEVGSRNNDAAAIGFVPAVDPSLQEALGGKVPPPDALLRAGFTVERAAQRRPSRLSQLLAARPAQEVAASQRTRPPDHESAGAANLGGRKAIDEVHGFPVELVGETSKDTTLAVGRHLPLLARAEDAASFGPESMRNTLATCFVVSRLHNRR